MSYRKLFSTLVCLVLLFFSFIDGKCADGKHQASATGEGASQVGVPPWFLIRLDAIQPTLHIAAGSGGSTMIRILLDRSLAGRHLTLSASDLPPGITASLRPVTSYRWILTLHAASDAVAGSYPVRINSTTPGLGAHVVVTAIVSAEVKLLDNSFETEADWSYSQPNGTSAQWAVVSLGIMPESTPHSGGAMASFNSYSATPGHQSLYQLKTGFAIPAAVSTATLKFWMHHDTVKSSNDTVRACISTDGKNFTDVGPTVPRYDGSTGWGEVSVDLSGYKGDNNVILGFLGTSGQGNDIYLDDVTVVAEAKSSPGMTVAAEPPAVTVDGGTSAIAAIITTVYGGYSSDLSLTASGLPSGVTATFEPAIIAAPGGGSATVTFTVSDSVPPGSYPVTISCAGGGATEQTTVPLTVTPTFSLTASPLGATITSKSPATFTVATKGAGGFNSPVALSVLDMPRDATATFAPATIAAPGTGTATLTFTAATSTPYGNDFPISLYASGGGVTQRQALYLTVHPDTTYLLAVSPASLSIGQHGIKKGTVTSTVSEVYNSSVALAVSGLPPDVTGTLSPAFIPFPGSGVATITFTAGAAAVPGTYPITFTSTFTNPDRQLTQKAEMNLIVFAAGPPNFSIPESGTVESFSELYSTFPEGSDGFAYARNMVVAKGPTLEREVSLALKGGYDSTFTSIDGTSVIEAPLVLRRGRLTLERFIIR